MIFSSLSDILNSGRVILVSSILLKNAQDLDLELIRRRPCDSNTNNPSVQRSNSNVIKEDPKKNYCQSKLMNALYARQVCSWYLDLNTLKNENISIKVKNFLQLARRFPSLQIFCVSPGWCKTQVRLFDMLHVVKFRYNDNFQLGVWIVIWIVLISIAFEFQLHRNTDIPWYGYIGIVVVGLFFMKSAKQVSYFTIIILKTY